MESEQIPTPEDLFDKDAVEAKLIDGIDEHMDRLTESLGDVPQETADFYESVKGLLDATLREKGVVDRKSFLEALEYRRGQGEDEEVINYIIKQTR